MTDTMKASLIMKSHVVLLYRQELYLPRKLFGKGGSDCKVAGDQLWGRRDTFLNS